MKDLLLVLLEDQLKGRGFRIAEHSEGMLIACGPKFRIRALTEFNSIQFGFEETFDRWANSSDYEAQMPESDKELDRLLETVGGLNRCNFCTSWKTPHKIANKPCCDECFITRTKKRDKDGKRRRNPN